MEAKRKIAKTLFVSLIFISLAVKAYATDRLVPGQYSTIQAAINTAQYGDTVLVSAGTYKEQLTMKNGVHLQGSGEDCIITYPDAVVEGTLINCINLDSNTSISNFYIKGKYVYRKNFVGIYCENSYLIIKNNKLAYHQSDDWSKASAIKIIGKAPQIINNLITKNTTGDYGAGIYSENAQPYIRGNIISENKAYDGLGIAGGAGIYIKGIGASPPKIINNVFYGNYCEWEKAYASMALYAPTARVILINNIFKSNKDAQLTAYCITVGSDSTVDYNDFFDNYRPVNPADLDEGNLQVNPLFMDETKRDFHLRSDSPCIDAGDPEILDADGSRSDMGAYGGDGDQGPVGESFELFSKASPFTNEAVDIVFTTLVKDEDAFNVNNYSITGGLRVNSVTKSGSRIYRLHTDIMVPSQDYIITATNIMALDGGIISSVYNTATFRGISDNPGAGLELSDKELLDSTEALSCRYAYKETLANGLIKDTSVTSDASIAATGFGLANLCTLYERYESNDNWVISGVTKADIRSRVEKILDTFILIQSRQIISADQDYYGISGLFWHFIGEDNKRSRSYTPLLNDEVSTIDNAILFSGIITAGQYFGGAIQEKAKQIINAAQWSYFFDTTKKQFYHGWRPSGFILQTWDWTTDETILICLIALANDPTNSDFQKAFYRFNRTLNTYQEYSLIDSWEGSMFQYLFAHMWFDFQKLGEDSPSAVGESAIQVDWWENTKQAILANRQFCINESLEYGTYATNAWGLTACIAADHSTYLGKNGGLPCGDPAGPFYEYGGKVNITPSAALMSFPFLNQPEASISRDRDLGRIIPSERLQYQQSLKEQLLCSSLKCKSPLEGSELEGLSNNMAFSALRYFYYMYYDKLWGEYGPVDSFDSTGNFCDRYNGINIGAAVCMIENYRSGIIWDNFMSQEGVQNASSIIFPNSQRPVLNEPSTWKMFSGTFEDGRFVVNLGSILKFQIGASDDDGAAFYYAKNLPEGASVDRYSGVFNWMPTLQEVGIYDVEIRVTDGNARWTTKDITILLTDMPEVNVSGPLTHDETWFGIINVTGPITVPAGITLTISPGSRVCFSPCIGAGLIIEGSLNAQGIQFTSNNPNPTKGDWQGISADNAQGFTIDSCILEYAQIPLQTTSRLTIPAINNCTIRHNSLEGIYLHLGSRTEQVSLNNNTLYDNGGMGICIYSDYGAGDVNLSLSGNTVYGNLNSGIYIETGADSTGNFNLQNNTIYNNDMGIKCWAASAGASHVSTLNLNLSNNNIHDNNKEGLYLERSAYGTLNITATNNTIYNNKTNGIRSHASEATLNYNNLYGNTSSDLYNVNFSAINAQHNWWGEATTLEMATGPNPKNITKIYDYYDQPAYGKVNYADWLSSEATKGAKEQSIKKDTKDVPFTKITGVGTPKALLKR